VWDKRVQREKEKTTFEFEVSKNAALLGLGTRINAPDMLHLIAQLGLSRCGWSRRMNFWTKMFFLNIFEFI